MHAFVSCPARRCRGPPRPLPLLSASRKASFAVLSTTTISCSSTFSFPPLRAHSTGMRSSSTVHRRSAKAPRLWGGGARAGSIICDARPAGHRTALCCTPHPREEVEALLAEGARHQGGVPGAQQLVHLGMVGRGEGGRRGPTCRGGPGAAVRLASGKSQVCADARLVPHGVRKTQ